MKTRRHWAKTLSAGNKTRGWFVYKFNVSNCVNCVHATCLLREIGRVCLLKLFCLLYNRDKVGREKYENLLLFRPHKETIRYKSLRNSSRTIEAHFYDLKNKNELKMLTECQHIQTLFKQTKALRGLTPLFQSSVCIYSVCVCAVRACSSAESTPEWTEPWKWLFKTENSFHVKIQIQDGWIYLYIYTHAQRGVNISVCVCVCVCVGGPGVT